MTRPIRILFHLDTLVIGGLERKVTQLVLHLDRGQFEPIVSYASAWGPYADELQAAGIPVIRIVPAAAKTLGVGKATAQIRELHPDIFHTFSCRQNVSDVFIAHRAKVPVIISARDNMRHWAPDSPARNWEFERNRKTNLVTPCCEAVAELCRKLEGLRSEKIATVLNGVALPQPSEGPTVRDLCGLPAGAFLIGYAARYRKLKAHENLLRAVRKIVQRRPDIHLVCCGETDAGMREQLLALVERLSLQQHVTLLGPLSDMDSFYRGLDLYVHPSSAEALSMAILEAMSYGLPVVATAVGGTSEALLDGITGRLVPRSDPGALSEAVIGLMDRPEIRSAMGTAGRERVEECFSLSGMVDAYASVYRRAVLPPAEAAALPGLPQFTGGATGPALADTTVFVTTIGDEVNFADCLAHLQAQTVRCPIVVIDRVAPMSAAFARMHKLCTTPYYVQVDEDMLLHPHCIETLHERLVNAPGDVAFVCAPLWDCDVEQAILGVKIYRHAIVSRFPYRNSLSCEVKQMNNILAAGYKTVLHSTGDDAICLGEHGKHYSQGTAFQRWQRLFHKHNAMGHLTWLEQWPARLMERYIATREPEHLYAVLGAIAGIAGQAEGEKELDWRDTNPALQRMQYYFGRYRETVLPYKIV